MKSSRRNLGSPILILKLIVLIFLAIYIMDLFSIVNQLHPLEVQSKKQSSDRKHRSKDDGFNNNKVDSEDGESFSACVLILDENHRLSEWIAYHYFAMRLRYLVVAVDPHSKTSPSRILNRWRDRMTVVEWTDSNFIDKSLINLNTDGHIKKTMKHRARQTDFYLECTRHLQNHNRSWTSYHDVDEFIAINADVVTHAQDLFRRPGSILRMVKKYSEPNDGSNHPKPKEKVGSPDNTEFWQRHFQQSCCISLPRVLYGAVESTDEEIAQGVPSIFVSNSKQFDTLRWRYRTTAPRGKSNGLAKSIMDVSKLRVEDYEGGSLIHRALANVCVNAKLNHYSLPLGFHHYLGSWEQYSFREDARKGTKRNEKWISLSHQKGGGADDEVRGWIAGFVELVGMEAAVDLLRDVGLPQHLTSQSG